jgi:signal transduction histidine kinase
MSQPRDSSKSSERRSEPRREQDRRLVQRDRELEAARLVCQALSQQIHTDKLVEQSLRTALEVVGAEAGSVLLADPKSRQLVFRHVVGEKAAMLRGLAIPWHKGLAGAVFSSGEPEIVADAKQDHRHYPDIDRMTGFHTRDMIVLPLKQWGREPIGVLEVMNKQEGRLNQDDVALLTIVSALSTAAIEQARLFEEARMAEVVHRLGDIGHDVNNLLVPVSLSASVVRTELDHLFTRLPDPDANRVRASYQLCKEALGTLEDTVRRIRDRMKQVADCVKGLKTPPQFGPCRLAEVVDSVVKVLGFVAGDKGIALHTDGLADLPPIQGDEQRLYSAFYNLINNAIPEVPRGGSITVRGELDKAGNALLVSVSDTGRGMPKEVRDSLFSDQTISRKAGGTGLGTRIVKDAVDAHGGAITVESAEGAGTTFQIRLPFQPPSGPTGLRA